jgi:hypothetical protein
MRLALIRDFFRVLDRAAAGEVLPHVTVSPSLTPSNFDAEVSRHAHPLCQMRTFDAARSAGCRMEDA